MLVGDIRAWLIWFVAGLFYLFEFIHRVAVSVMIPELSETFSVGSAQLSNLSAAYFLAYAFAQIPVGILIDRYGTRILLTIASAAITISTFAFACTQSLSIAHYCRIIIGLGSAFAFVGCLKLAASWFPAYRYAFIVGLTNMLGVIGAIIAGGPLSIAVTFLGWRSTMYLLGLFGVVITFMLWKIVRDSKKAKQIKQKSERTPILHNFKKVLMLKQTWWVAIFASCMVAPIVTYAELWGVTYLIKVYDLSRTQAAQITTMTFIGIGLGGPTIGWISDYYRNRIFFMGFGLVGSLISISLILFGPALPLPILYLLHISFGFFTSSMLLVFTLNAESSTDSSRATTVAFTNCLIMVLGAFLQMLSGRLLENTLQNFTLSFMPIIICYVLALISFICIKEPKCEFAE